MARASGKEAFRLWFEYLKRAYQSTNVQVDTKYYDAWGDVANAKFETWWKAHGHVLFPLSKVEIVKRYLSDAEFVQVKVPKSLTPTQAANQLRETLIEHYQAIDHVPKPKRTYALTVDAEIKVSAFRAYLVTYDAQVKLAEQYKDGVVPAKELLNEVRKYYLARSHRWRNTKRKVEALPPSLAGDFVYDPATNTVAAKDRYDSGAIRTVRMYLKKANSLILASATGDFPGKSYYKS
jgi:hypothetical protein